MDELDLTDAEKKAAYQEIKDYVLEHSDLKVSSLYISQVKQQCGIIERVNYNKPKSEDAKQPQCPPDKKKEIRGASAFRHDLRRSKLEYLIYNDPIGYADLILIGIGHIGIHITHKKEVD